jgi:hypothetical protein
VDSTIETSEVAILLPSVLHVSHDSKRRAAEALMTVAAIAERHVGVTL